MPGGDRTGPLGLGPGWGRGPCGRGLRRRLGRFMPGLTKEEEKEMLQRQVDALEEEKAELKKRMEQL